MCNKLLGLMVLSLLVTACALHGSRYGYAKPGADSNQFYEDFRLCELQNIIFKGRHFLNRRQECMLEEGWRLTADPRAFRPSDYTRSDGRLFPPPPLPW